jgi:hypothetical protein
MIPKTTAHLIESFYPIKPVVILHGLHSTGLCNKIFLMSHFIAAAWEYDFWVMYPTFAARGSQHYSGKHGSFFIHTVNNPLCLFPFDEKLSDAFPDAEKNEKLVEDCIAELSTLSQLPNQIYLNQIKHRQKLEIDESFVETIRQHRISFFSGFAYRNQNLFDKYADQIRALFTPLPQYTFFATQLIQSIRKSCDVLIGVHIRQGDYGWWKNGDYFLSLEQYQVILKVFTEVNPQLNIYYVISSKELKDSEKIIFSGLNCHFSSGEVMEDVLCLSQCDCILGPPSTFSLWAAFYGKTKVYHIADLELIKEVKNNSGGNFPKLKSFAEKIITTMNQKS